ncbi:hypothetical protein Tco_1500165 [Tanacetum coccineum]
MRAFMKSLIFSLQVTFLLCLSNMSHLYVSYEPFCANCALETTKDGVHAITATIDGRDKIITEASIRRHLKLQDSEGLSSLPNAKIFKQLARIGYATTSKSLTFLKGHFAPQWKFFIHTILHCISSKKTAWDQFSSNIATAIPQGKAPSTSPSRITSLPSLSSHPTTSSTLTTPPSIQIIHEAGETTTMPYDSPLPGDMIEALEKDLQQTKKTYITALTKLVLNVKKLEKQVRSGKARRRARIVLLEDEDATEDPSKQGKKIAQIDTDPTISLVPDEGTSWSASKRKRQREKAIMQEPEPPKKLKKRVQVQMSVDEELERKGIDVSSEVPNHRLLFRVILPMLRFTMLFRKVDLTLLTAVRKELDQTPTFVPMDSEDKEKDSEKKGSRKKSLARKRAEEFAMEIESLATKYPIVDWKTHVLTENFMYYQIFKADGSVKNYKIFSEMLDDYDRQDVLDLHGLVKTRYMTSSPEDYDLML